ncbi:NAD(P)H-binding protein [Roseinatronobacter alkalisoli]|uniref:NAD(P)H-binding protein n=1 Tax=Roseinatronobacter alkalisoli TaxID=3028235 RepID=A0ABT5T6V5_9RHOB|nr:NAD(P)H-binding protein [Roseinatronobacter sp. HJB301]MDD7970857.1 NAD(P)H-binding protein [Roseinatronobacter sp. HJB301]
MYIILGGTGQVGSATARALLDEGEAVTIVTRDESHGKDLYDAGAKIVVADVRNVEALKGVFRLGKRAFLLNPPAPPSSATDKEERANVAAIMSALDGSGLEKVVAASTYGAFDGECCGDLTILHAFELALKRQTIPAAINRAGYYMSNWAGMAELVQQNGALPSFFPAALTIPMVAPADLGIAAARRLMSGTDDVGIEHIEGPERYTANDVAAAFADMIGRKVEVQEVPRDALENTFREFGFSEEAAASYACMTRRLIDGKTMPLDEPTFGSTSLKSYIASVLS